jgi:hypothetical protein
VDSFSRFSRSRSKHLWESANIINVAVQLARLHPIAASDGTSPYKFKLPSLFGFARRSATAVPMPAPAQAAAVGGTESQTLNSTGGGLHPFHGASAICKPVQEEAGITA